MNRNSILLGRAFGIPIRAHILLVLFLPILAMIYSNSFVIGLVLVIGVFTSVALHELGHSVVAIRKGCHVQEIMLSPIGGVAKISGLPSHPLDEFQIAIAGPAVSLTLGIIGILSGSPLLGVIGVINLFLFGFNLLPCFPMDGGRILRSFLAARRGRVEATRIAIQVGKYFCIFFIISGLLKMQFLLAFIGFYIYQAGQQEYRMVLMEHQATPFSGGFQTGNIDVEVSPPPYEGRRTRDESLAEKLRRLFRS
ncbi:MAG TPA: site-2 protease family protein [Pontiella sp.]